LALCSDRRRNLVIRSPGSRMLDRSTILFLALGSTAAVSLLTSFFIARHLGPDEFGLYALGLAILIFLSLFSDFGYFSSGARLLTTVEDAGEKKMYIGALLGIAGVSAAGFAAVVLLVSFVVDGMFNAGTGHLLRICLWATPALVLPHAVDQALKALQRVHLLGIWHFGSRLLFFGVAIGGGLKGVLSAEFALQAYLGTQLAALIGVILAMEPKFRGLRSHWAAIMGEHRRFGRPLYMGKVVAMASYNSDKLLLGALRDAAVVGHYSLAVAFGNGVGMFASATAAASFRDFANRRTIAGELIRTTVIGMVVLAGITLVGANALVWLYLGPAYGAVSALLFPAMVASVLQGAYQPFNSWLLANGLGVEIRRYLVIVTLVNLAANAVLIPLFGGMGAAVASICGMGTHLLLSRGAYRAAVGRLATAPSDAAEVDVQ
jgi:O-antigen/teichoic acid export membrane protein